MKPILFKVHAYARQQTRREDCPEFVPWDFISDCEPMAQRNHSQSLERLNERGGLSPLEIFAVKMELCWTSKIMQGMSEDTAVDWLIKALSDYAQINASPLKLTAEKLIENLEQELIAGSRDIPKIAMNRTHKQHCFEMLGMIQAWRLQCKQT